MKIISTLSFFIFSIIIFWQTNKIETLANEVSKFKTSVDQYNKRKFNKWERDSYYQSLYFILKEPNYPYSNEEISEMHWILLQTGWETRFVKIEYYNNKKIILNYKFATLKNLNDGSGIDSLMTNKVQDLDLNSWNEFKGKINTLNFYDASYWNGHYDCFGSSLTWFAAIGNNDYKFSSNCGIASTFENACFFIMTKIKDKELQNYLK